MKKLISFALYIAIASICLQGRCQTANQYTIKGKIETNGKPARAYLQAFPDDNSGSVDSVDVVNNAFEFKGIAEEPFKGEIAISYDPDAPFEFTTAKDRIHLYIEPGTITLTSTNLIRNAIITGSPLNDEAKAWWEKFEAMDDGRPDSELLSILMADYIRANPGSWFAIDIAYTIARAGNRDVETEQTILDRFTPEMRATRVGRAYQAEIDSWKLVQTGRTAPDFTLNDAEGNPVSLSDCRGKWVLVDFRAAWCGPCRAEIPNVVAAYRRFKDNGFSVLGVSLDNDRAAWLEAVEADKLEWKQVYDIEREIAKLYGVTAIPSNFLINPEGIIIGKNLRGDALATVLEKNLGVQK